MGRAALSNPNGPVRGCAQNSPPCLRNSVCVGFSVLFVDRDGIDAVRLSTAAQSRVWHRSQTDGSGCSHLSRRARATRGLPFSDEPSRERSSPARTRYSVLIGQRRKRVLSCQGIWHGSCTDRDATRAADKTRLPLNRGDPMSVNPLLRKSRDLVIPVLSMMYAAGCGGSSFSTGAGGMGGAGGTVVGQGGSPASGGAGGSCHEACVLIGCGPGSTEVTEPGQCCPTCVPDGSGGTNSGGTNSGGTSSGGTGAGGACTGMAAACSAIACGPGYKSVKKPGQCCPTCVMSGAGGTSGTAGTGGAPNLCGGIACPAIACRSGYTSVKQPGQCCPTCVPDGAGGTGGTGTCTVSCPAVVCAEGYTSFTAAGQCCPMCVPAQACTMGQDGYAALRTELLQQPGALTCKVSADCTLLHEDVHCIATCWGAPVSSAAEPGIDNQLSSYAMAHCATCTPVDLPCASSPVPAACSNGQCVR